MATSQISKLSASPDPSIDGLSTVLIVGGGCCGLLAGVALSGICDVHIYEQRDEILASESGDIGYLVTEELDQFLKQHKVPLVRLGWRAVTPRALRASSMFAAC